MHNTKVNAKYDISKSRNKHNCKDNASLALGKTNTWPLYQIHHTGINCLIFVVYDSLVVISIIRAALVLDIRGYELQGCLMSIALCFKPCIWVLLTWSAEPVSLIARSTNCDHAILCAANWLLVIYSNFISSDWLVNLCRSV